MGTPVAAPAVPVALRQTLDRVRFDSNMRTQSFTTTHFVALRLDPGDELLLSLREAVRAEGIENAVILAGVGSLDRYHFHVVTSTNMPPGNTFVRGEGPFDILTVTGTIIDGDVHAHVTCSNTEVAMGGHVEEGCRVLTFAAIVLAEAPDADFAGWDRLGPRSSTSTDTTRSSPLLAVKSPPCKANA
jgi:predicted DNA-binding protein with PD1-like motif